MEGKGRGRIEYERARGIDSFGDLVVLRAKRDLEEMVCEGRDTVLGLD